MALVEEIALHLEDHYREARSAGASGEDAYRTSMSELDGTLKKSKERRLPMGDDIWRDIRYAFCTMRKNPIFVLFVVLTLGLGIGANATVFIV